MAFLSSGMARHPPEKFSATGTSRYFALVVAGERVVVDAWSRLICAGWLPQDGVRLERGSRVYFSSVDKGSAHSVLAGLLLTLSPGFFLREVFVG